MNFEEVGKRPMTCEEFEEFGLARESELILLDGQDSVVRAAADHADQCSRCAALRDSWQDVHAELRGLAEETRNVGAPLRVEMRLKQEFLARRKSRVRSGVLIAGWVLAGASVLVGAVNWWNQRTAETGQNRQPVIALQSTANPDPSVLPREAVSGDSTDATGGFLVAENSAYDFTLLPGSVRQETDDPAIVRVRMQRGALNTLGLQVNEERATEWIQVDLLVGSDGQPQAVRLPQ